MRRTAVAMGRVAALRYVGACVCALSAIGCGAHARGPSNAQLAEVARQQVCVCAKLDGESCAALTRVPVRFSAGAVILKPDGPAPACYSKERGIEVATLDAHEGDLANGWRSENQPWTPKSNYELLHQLRHEYLHAAGFEHPVFGTSYRNDPEFACEWER